MTLLLDRIRGGDTDASHELFGLVYDELRALAGAVFGPGQRGHTLQPTALVHEAWLKLAGNMEQFEGQRHFLAVAAKAMRHVLADHAKGRSRDKRGGGIPTVALEEGDAAIAAPAVDLLALNEALDKLSRLNERHSRVVELRLLGSMTVAEVAETLDVSPRTVESDWRLARVWLWRELVA